MVPRRPCTIVLSAGLSAAYGKISSVRLLEPKTHLTDCSLTRPVSRFGTRERLAMEILLHTGLRRGDAVRLGRQHVKGGYISIVMEKTSNKIEIPMSQDLAAVINASPTGDLTYLVTATGQAMAKESFGNWFRKSCKTAGVQASAHGLRKLAATKLAEAGATESQLSAVFGWRSNRQSEVYTRSVNRRKLAAQAFQKLKR